MLLLHVDLVPLWIALIKFILQPQSEAHLDLEASEILWELKPFTSSRWFFNRIVHARIRELSPPIFGYWSEEPYHSTTFLLVFSNVPDILVVLFSPEWPY